MDTVVWILSTGVCKHKYVKVPGAWSCKIVGVGRQNVFSNDK